MPIGPPANSPQAPEAVSTITASPARPPIVLVTFAYMATVVFATIAYGVWYTRFAGWLGKHAEDFPALLRYLVIAVSICWAIMLARWAFLLTFSYMQLVRESRIKPVPITKWPHVSIIIPAFNEEETIVGALSSLWQLDYPSFDVAVIDDGSADHTFELADRFAKENPELNISVYRKANGGKWSAHNFGLQRTLGELVLCLDADSRLRPAALKLLVARLHDRNVAAVAGQVSVRNRTNLLTYLQSLEYLMANGALRLAQSYFGQVLVVPGPIGLFRRKVLDEVHLLVAPEQKSLQAGEYRGPFEGDTFAEDFDLSLAILSLGYRITYEPMAVSDTKAPDSLLVLLNQRYRWSRGSLQVIRKFLRRLKSKQVSWNPGLFAWLCFCYFLEISIFPFVYGMGIVSLTPFLMYPSTFALMMTGTLLIWGLNASISGLYVAVHRDRWRLLSAVPFLDFYFGLFLSAGLVYSLLDEFRSKKMTW